MDLLSQEWSHLKGMPAVLLTMSNFQHFIALKSVFLKFSKEKNKISPQNLGNGILTSLYS